MYGEVVEVRELTPRLVRVVLGGDGLADFSPTGHSDQYVNMLFVPEGAPYSVPFDVDAARSGPAEHRPRGRRFTVRSWDPDRRLLVIDFVVHGDVGYAGRWVLRARPGDLIQFLGPSGGYTPDPEAVAHLLVGDESALPAIAASLERIRPGVPAHVVAMVDDAEGELPLASPGEVAVTWLHRLDLGEVAATDALVAAVAGLDLAVEGLDVFVHGEASEVRAVRRHLAGRGVAVREASISPYWRRGDTDESWRAQKAAWVAEVEREG